jgi:hypothetical protein
VSPYGESVPRQAYGQLWLPGDPPGTYDDEFTADSIAAGTWAQTGTWSAATPPDPTASFAAGNIRYSISGSRLKIQPPADGNNYYLYKQLGGGLPDGTYHIGARSAFREGSTPAGDACIGLFLAARSAGVPVPLNDGIACYMYGPAGAKTRLSAFKMEGGVITSDVLSSNEWNQGWSDFVIIKNGNVYNCFGCGTAGYYVHMGTYTYGGAATIDCVAMRLQNSNTTLPGNLIVGVDYFRYNASGMLP